MYGMGQEIQEDLRRGMMRGVHVPGTTRDALGGGSWRFLNILSRTEGSERLHALILRNATWAF